MNNVFSIAMRIADKVKKQALNKLLRHNVALNSYLFDSHGEFIEYSSQYEMSIVELSKREKQLLQIARLIWRDEKPKEKFNIEHLNLELINILEEVILFINNAQSAPITTEV